LKSLARQKSERKQKGAGRKSSGGHKATRTMVRAYSRTRMPVPQRPPKPKQSIGAEPRQRIAGLVRIEVTKQWDNVPELSTPTERCTLTAVLEDGRRIACDAIVQYETGERERILEGMMTGSDDPQVLRLAEQVPLRRIMAMQTARGTLQREFGNGVPWLAT
jgi:hypothetical protein